jgi:WD40 repeat protein
MTAPPPKPMASFHAGKITGLDVCPCGPFAATTGDDGTVRIYNYETSACLQTYRTEIAGGTAIVWAPNGADRTHRTIFAGFTDGTVRTLRFTSETGGGETAGLLLSQATKPHTKPVTLLKVAREGNSLVTSDGESIFFFDVHEGGADGIHPVGMLRLDGGVNSIRYGPRSAKILVGFASGRVAEIRVPRLGEVDVSRTFDITASVEVVGFQFVSVMPKIVAARLATAEAKNPKKKKKKKKEGEPTGADGTAGGEGGGSDADGADGGTAAAAGGEPSGEGDDGGGERGGEGGGEDGEDGDEGSGETAKATKANKQKGRAPPPPSQVLDVWYTNRGTMMVTLDGEDRGFLYECSLDFPEPSAWYPMHGGSTAAVRAVHHDPTSGYLLLGADDGTIRAHETDDLSCSVALPLHDGAVGRPKCLVPSFDMSRLLTVGADGNFFVLRVALDGFAERKQRSYAKLLPPFAETEASVPDILAANFYSIEEAKQKEETDRKKMTAEEKKAEDRKKIRLLRRQFERLVKENSARPAALQLPRSAFLLDPQFESDAKARTQLELDRLSAEMAWTVEYHTIAHQKLRQRFLARLMFPRFTVNCIGSTENVSSYRLTEPSKEMAGDDVTSCDDV